MVQFLPHSVEGSPSDSELVSVAETEFDKNSDVVETGTAT